MGDPRSEQYIFCGVRVNAIMHCTFGLQVMAWAAVIQIAPRNEYGKGLRNLLEELTSIHEPQRLFARLRSSGTSLGEGVMTGCGGEA